MKLSGYRVSYKLLFRKFYLKFNKLVLQILILIALLLVIVTQTFKTFPFSRNQESSEINTSTLTIKQSFADLMQAYPWEQYRNAVNENNIVSIRNQTELLLTTILVPFTIMEPNVPANLSCQVPPILEPETIGPCVRLKDLRKVGVILNFGFDVEALELHLHELDSVVDKFFLMEGTKIHNPNLNTKPSIWDMIKYTPRFSQFRAKIIHFILDDGDYAIKENLSTNVLPDVWGRENLQKKIRLEKFLKWNSATGYFGPQDIIGIGDTDEIPSRHNINFLKSCEYLYGSETVRIGIWFPFPYVDTMFKSYAPVSSKYPFAYTNSIYSTVTAFTNSLSYIPGADSVKQYVVKEEDAFIAGGMHFSKYLYLPFQLLKIITGTESEKEGLNQVIEIGSIYKSGKHGNDTDLDDLAINWWLKKWEWINDRIQSVDLYRLKYGDKEADKLIRLPWFYECNPNRYPSFHRKRDTRLL